MNKTTFGILTIILNSYGVPCFIQGNVKAGILRIVLGIVSCGVIAIINAIKGIILGIQVLKMTEEEFQAKLGTIDSGIPAMQ
jgi:hypothetical protein